ncbi:MAG TPA: cbb3-type cytochrome c oxidase N-terminal domain-containing protein, partial [Polyangiaceae bacterium]|nr:cbb3-type cytochrome c oxidase N-terminal domain-containing protein [Polyangiaceae bacterium]
MNEPVSTSSRPPSKAPPAEEHRADTASVLDHEYDGIREYDNPLPRWWVNIFWGSFVFAIGYFFH